MPQTSADAPLEEPVWRESPKGNGKDPIFVSPMYERLEANLPKSIMAHSDMPYPDDCQLFPPHETTLEYLERYTDEVRALPAAFRFTKIHSTDHTSRYGI